MIKFACEKCWQSLNVKDELVGRLVRCPRCKSAQQVPDTRIADNPSTAALALLQQAATAEQEQARPAPSPYNSTSNAPNSASELRNNMETPHWDGGGTSKTTRKPPEDELPQPVSIRDNHIDVPRYEAVRILGSAFMVTGGLIVGLGASLCVGLLIIIGIMMKGDPRPAKTIIEDIAEHIAVGIVLLGLVFLAGLICFAVGQAMIMFRDMAQNSWRVMHIVNTKYAS